MSTTIEKAVLTGHNVLITGSAGTGKSVLVTRKLFSERTTHMTASTEIATCNVNGVTIHKFIGIMDGRYGNVEIPFKIMNEERFYKVKDRLQKVECIFIDEISMLSLKTFI